MLTPTIFFIGYVAVTGLPDPQADHAIRMTKFAREIILKTEEVTKDLEVTLGPDTGDLCLRLGMNSGPVTAGVLQGEKSRFQVSFKGRSDHH
jgi:class 3 adenylate cyclase